MTLHYEKHKSILLDILKDIYSDTALAPYLGFKGGTAAHLFYDLDRGSVDLDFDLLEANKESVVLAQLQKICASHGNVIDSRVKRFNLINVLSYAKGAQKIKVEVNRRNFGSAYEAKTLLGIPMLVMTKEDMAANKLMAMSERISKTSRDIYDVWFFLKNHWDINEQLIEKRLGISLQELLTLCIDLLEHMDNKRILVGLGELLNDTQKRWARAKLKSDTLFLLKSYQSVLK